MKLSHPHFTFKQLFSVQLIECESRTKKKNMNVSKRAEKMKKEAGKVTEAGREREGDRERERCGHLHCFNSSPDTESFW